MEAANTSETSVNLYETTPTRQPLSFRKVDGFLIYLNSDRADI
jgi:hypothetical protein